MTLDPDRTPTPVSAPPPRISDAALNAADEDARQAAVTVFDRPFVLEAGAGSGKTATLVARIVAWSLGPGWSAAAAADPTADGPTLAAAVLERVVAITFTEAAAAEMAARVAGALAGLASAPAEVVWPSGDPRVPQLLGRADLGPPPLRRERARHLHGALDRLTIRTIHGFCHGLLAAHPLAAAIHPAFTVDADGRRLAEVARSALERHLVSELARDGAGQGPLLALLAAGVGSDELLAALTALRDAGVAAAELADPFGPARLGRWRRACQDAVDRFVPLLPRLRLAKGSLTETTVAALDATAELLREHRNRGAATLQEQLAELWARPRTKLDSWVRASLTKSETAAIAPDQPILTSAAADLADVLDGLLNVDLALGRAAFSLLGTVLGEIEATLARQGVLGFADLLAGAVRLLESDPGLAGRLRRGIGQLLVDELQDTDALQCRLLRLLALEGPPEERPRLFVVGDPKQTIYAWRAADLASYETLLADVDAAGGVRHRLTRSFRSRPAILAEVDRALGPVMEPAPGLQPRYERLVPTRSAAPPGSPPAVEIWLARDAAEPRSRHVPPSPTSRVGEGGREGVGGDPMDALAVSSPWNRPSAVPAGAVPAAGSGATAPAAGPSAAVATSAEETRRREAAAIAADLLARRADGSLGAYRDAAILLRSFTELDDLLAALREHGIPFEVARERDYYRRREVIEAAALLRTIADPADQIALVTTLRSPLVGVPDAALLPLWRRDLPQRLATLTGPDPAALAALEAAIREAAATTPRDVPGIRRVAGWEESLRWLVGLLAERRAALDHEPPDAWIERLRRATLLEALAAARYLGRHRVANLERFFTWAIDTLEASGGDWPALLRELRQRTGAADSPATLAARPAGDAVQVGTMHAAKGLEFPHVYLPQLDRQSADAHDDSPAAWRDGDGGWELQLLPKVASLGWPAVRRRRRAVARHEQVRLLYVAMTRAADRLVLLGRRTPPADRGMLALLAGRLEDDPLAGGAAPLRYRQGDHQDAPNGNASVAGGMTAAFDVHGTLWRTLEPVPEPVHPAGQDAGAIPLPDLDAIERETATLSRARTAARARMARPWGAAASAEAHRQLAHDRDDEPSEPHAPAGIAREVAMAVGTAIHAALAEVDLAALANLVASLGGSIGHEPSPTAAAIGAQLSPIVHRQLAVDLDDPALAAATTQADRLLAAVARGQLLPRLAALAANVIGRELPVLLPANPRSAQTNDFGRMTPKPDHSAAEADPAGDPDAPVAVRVGTIDLVYRDPADGTLVVADFKTDLVPGDLALEARAAAYAPQVRTYATALRSAWGLAVAPRCQLWFLAEDRLLEVPAPG